MLTDADPRLLRVVAGSGRDVIVVDPEGRPGGETRSRRVTIRDGGVLLEAGGGSQTLGRASAARAGTDSAPWLAAVAAAVALGIDAETIRRGPVPD